MREPWLAPEVHDAFQAFNQEVFANGAPPAKTKQLIAVAVAHVTQCPYCIKGHTKAAPRRYAQGTDGGDLGCGRDAGRGRLCPLGPRNRGDAEGSAEGRLMVVRLKRVYEPAASDDGFRVLGPVMA